ncbi:MAG: tripartite tricarboxylate transporter substrate binding protein [Betaproteobacteria bacterium]|nr:tripartite tricarboxylate transporter substrate binding protein [Betaproteobacteria bacterium]
MIKQMMRVLISVAAVAIAVPVSAQEFPSRPAKIVVPQTPGGASDALARIVGQKLSEKWQQPVVVENRPGAGGNLGMEFVAQAPADGYTLLMSYVGSHAINAALYKKLPFDPERDFAPVATLATLPFVLVARPDAPFKTVRELADLGKRQPLTFGSAGNGSVNHLLGVMFNAAAGSKLEHIPYRGAAPAMQDLMSGQISLVFTSLPSVASAIRSGSLRGIAVTSAQRSQSFAQIPTIAEAGYKDFDVSPWFGLFAPAKTPPAIVRRMNQDIQEILKNREVIEKFQGQGADPFITQPAEFAAILKSDLAKWSEVVKASGAQID